MGDDRGPGTRSHPQLSSQENEILWLAVEGHADREIARRLRLTPEAVRRLLYDAFSKLASDGPDDPPAGLRDRG
jgi:DNA-binding CsgD family transcriptional regulator